MITEAKYKYPLEVHPAPKGVCPQCSKVKSFRHFENLPREYGICDHKNSCGYENIPKGDVIERAVKNEVPPEKIVYPTEQFCKTVIDNQSSEFHTFCKEQLHTPPEHLTRWHCGTVEDKTAFVYTNIYKKHVNIVHIEYGTNGKRNKEKFPYSLKPKKGEKYSLCLFGEHLLSDKIVCLVESEKTAIIASFVYPQFDWIATGGANKLTGEKIGVLFGREIYYLCDADKAGKENSTIKRLQEYKQNFKVIDLFPDKTNGYDIADAIIDGLHPEIKPPETTETKAKEPPATNDKQKNKSLFELVQDYLSERYEIQYNEVSNEIEARKKGESTPFQVLNENNIYVELQTNRFNISQANLAALLRSDFVTRYNPFNDYFENLGEWTDTEPDYILKLSEYVPVKETDVQRFRVQFKKMFVRSVACALMPKVFNKQAFIFVHDQQNSGKSTFCRWLCPEALSNYIAENINTDKDGQIALSTNFIINMDELATLNKVEITAIKTFMSKDVINVRRPYDKKPTQTPRRANFVGSTNKNEFLSDETGSVRWLCFELTGRFNFDYKKDIDINNVWRQANALFKQGFKYELTPDEIRENELANKEYMIATEEQELIQANYLPASQHDSEAFYTSSDFKRYLTEKYVSVKLNVYNIGRALKTLGFIKVVKRREGVGHPEKGYYIKFR